MRPGAVGRMLLLAWSGLVLFAAGLAAQAPAGLALQEQRVAVAPATAGARGDHPAHDGLASMSVQEQRATLLSVIRATGGACEALSGAYFAGIDAEGMAYWDVRCRDRAAWRIAFPRDGNAAEVTACPREIGACFVPAPHVRGDAGPIRRARCSAACELRSGPARQTCIAQCLHGTEAIAGVGGGGNDRYVVIFVADLPMLTEGFVAGARDAALARETARSACAAMAGAESCRLAVATINKCAAVVQAPDGSIVTGTGIELDDAEREARTSCVHGGTCQLIVSGC